MAFCTKCGADVTSKSFCVQCGAQVGSVQPSAVSQIPPAIPPAIPAAKKGVSPIVWIVGGIVGLFVLIGVVITSAGLYLAHKVTENPAETVAKILTAANPDVDVVSADKGKNTVTLRDKKTGETVTMNFDEVTKGKIVFKGNGQEATIHARGEGPNGTLEINSSQGNMKFGAGSSAKLPDWAPVYPGVKPETTFSMQGNDGEGGTFQFTTKDAPKSVLSYYEDSLKRAGFTISGNMTGESGGSSGGMVSAEDAANKRTVIVTVGSESGTTSVNVVFGTKK